METKKNKTYKTYICPSPLVKDVLLENKLAWESQKAKKKGVGSEWASTIAKQVEANSSITEAAAERSLRSIMNDESSVITIYKVDTIFLALDIHIDLDTNIPILPGNRRLARELLEVRAYIYEETIMPKERLPLIKKVLDLSNSIIEDPYNASKYQDQAPYDCLRPPKPHCVLIESLAKLVPSK